MKSAKQKSDPDIERVLHRVSTAPKSVLRAQYRELFDREAPEAFGPDLLRRAVAYRVQENAYGGLSKSAKRELDRLVRTKIANPKTKLVVARRVQSGTELVRDWKGKSHRVLLLDQGFNYGGRTYSNLSVIARLITGTRWNGPRFFGLRRHVRSNDGAGSANILPSKARARVKVDSSTRTAPRALRFKQITAHDR